MPDGQQGLLLALEVMVQRNVSIAIESGGHSSNPGASNIAGGITIDLAKFNTVTLTDHDQSVWIGPAARWSDVYTFLEHHGLTVSGGRVGHVGVGGYVFGGGFSWFANQHGWTCDSVLEFEVITPNRRLLHARKDWNGDLFWALKGSLGAFGLVTAIKLPILPHREVYGGPIGYAATEASALFDALHGLNLNAGKDLRSQGYLSFGWSPSATGVEYTAYLLNIAGNEAPPAFENFTSMSSIHNGMREMTIKESANEIARSNPLGYRRAKFTLTAKSSVEAMEVVRRTVEDFINVYREDLAGDKRLGVTLQPLTMPHVSIGDNIFSLKPEDGPLLLISAEIWWKDATRDKMLDHYSKELYGRMIQGLGDKHWHPWLYPNYAAKWQEPFSGRVMPDRTRRSLTKVREKYDPDGVWKRLVPGVWHID